MRSEKPREATPFGILYSTVEEAIWEHRQHLLETKAPVQILDKSYKEVPLFGVPLDVQGKLLRDTVGATIQHLWEHKLRTAAQVGAEFVKVPGLHYEDPDSGKKYRYSASDLGLLVLSLHAFFIQRRPLEAAADAVSGYLNVAGLPVREAFIQFLALRWEYLNSAPIKIVPSEAASGSTTFDMGHGVTQTYESTKETPPVPEATSIPEADEEATPVRDVIMNLLKIFGMEKIKKEFPQFFDQTPPAPPSA